MIFLSVVLNSQFMPEVASMSNQGTACLVMPTLVCKFENGNQCPDYVSKNFDFYAKLMFSRKTPYTIAEINSKYSQITSITHTIYLTITKQDFKFNLYDQEGQIDSEKYSIKYDSADKQIKITAATTMAASRAFATLQQSAQPNSLNVQDEQLYQILALNVAEDKPSHSWRHYNADACAHFMTLDDVKRVIDAASMQKFNVLILTLGCAFSFPLQFKGKPQNKLVFGSWTNYHYYSEAVQKEIAFYGQMRGVIVVPEVRMPSHAYSWRHADMSIVASCFTQTSKSPNSAALNPLSEQTYKYVFGVIDELVLNFFFEVKAVPTLHLGGHDIYKECWKEDKTIAGYVQQTVGMTYEKLWQQFHQKVVDYIKQSHKDLIAVFNEGALRNNNTLTDFNAIVHFTTNADKTLAATKQIKTIYSVNWDLSLMHPAGGYHYFYSDVWMDFNGQNPDAGIVAKLALGGGVWQPGNNCWAHACEQHAFTRGSCIANKLWSKSNNNHWGGHGALESMGCHLSTAGIGNGPLDIGPPCVGYKAH